MLAKIWLVRFPIGIPITPPSLTHNTRPKTVHDLFEQIIGSCILDFKRKNFKQRFLINAVEKFPDISLPNIGERVLFQKCLCPLNRAEQTFFHAARPRVVNESLIINTIQIIVHQPMHHSISNRGYRNFSSFVIAHHKFFITAMPVSSIIQILEQRKNVLFQTILELVQFLGAAFSFSEGKPAVPYIS